MSSLITDNIGGTNCDHVPSQGVVNAWFINVDDIDRVASSVSGVAINSIALKTGANIYKLPGEKVSKGNSEFVELAYSCRAYKHTVELTVVDLTIANRERIREFAGSRVVCIQERLDSSSEGTAKFEVFGWQKGIKASSSVINNAENSGVATITLATKDGEEESNDQHIFLDTDISTTQTWLDANSK